MALLHKTDGATFSMHASGPHNDWEIRDVLVEQGDTVPKRRCRWPLWVVALLLAATPILSAEGSGPQDGRKSARQRSLAEVAAALGAMGRSAGLPEG